MTSPHTPMSGSLSPSIDTATVPSTPVDSSKDATASKKLYAAVWRWHFYAGLFVAPFLIALALTGLVMIYGNAFQSRLGPEPFSPPETPTVENQPSQLRPLSEQMAVAAAAIENGQIKQYVAPATPQTASQFLVGQGEETVYVVNVDPAQATVLSQRNKAHTPYYFADNLHGTLMLGDAGDRLIEIAACLGLFLLVSGAYLWWPRGERRWRDALSPKLRARQGRAWWKALHAVLGAYTAVALLFFLISGLAWAGVWGGQFVQAWSSFPAGKWGNPPAPQSAEPAPTHASLNHGGGHDVPWGLEQTPMPTSTPPSTGHHGSTSSTAASPTQPGPLQSDGPTAALPVTLDSVRDLAHRLGFSGRFHVDLPQGPTGVYSISRDSMSGDSPDATQDRTVHVDRYSGRVLADIRYADYSPLAKAMAIGIALHQGDLGGWNLALNAVLCLSIVLLSASGVVMWWKRRPKGGWSLTPPPWPKALPAWKLPATVLALLSVAFPMLGVTLVGLWLLDGLLISRSARLQRWLK